MKKRKPYYRPEHDPNIAVWVFIVLATLFVVYQVWEWFNAVQ